MIGEGYAAIPTWMLRDESLSAPALLAYASLASRAGFESNHPGQETIAREARCGVRRVSDALKELEDRGLIERIERRFASGARASDGYVLHSGVRPSPHALPPAEPGALPAPSAGSGNLPADSDGTYLQIRESIPSIEITRVEIDKGSKQVRADVAGLLNLLDEEILRNGARKPPSRTQGNENAMRLLIDRDGYEVAEVADVIRWCQADQFWHTNILSAAKLRKQFPTLLSQMRSGRGRNGVQSAASRALGVDLGVGAGEVANGRQNGVQGSRPSIIGEIESGRF